MIYTITLNQVHVIYRIDFFNVLHYLSYTYHSSGKITVGYFRVKIVHDEIFSFLGHPTKIFNNELCSLIVHIILHSHNMHYTSTDYGVLALIGSLRSKIHTSNSSMDLYRPGCFILRHQFAQGFQFPRIDKCIH